jgi:hypothetical protein
MQVVALLRLLVTKSLCRELEEQDGMHMMIPDHHVPITVLTPRLIAPLLHSSVGLWRLSILAVVLH